MSIWLTVVILAVIQGITEFLPVSSSGHLAVIGALCGLKSDVGTAFSIVLHAGSLLAIIAFYFKTLLSLLQRERFKIVWFIIVGSVPAGIAGVTMKITGFDEMMFGDLLSIGMSFLITASVLRLSGKEKMIRNAVTPLEKMSLKHALIVGFAQMAAITPGISRSGSTIAAGVLSGLQFEAAAAFSFLLAIPAVGGAMMLELISLIKDGFIVGELSGIQLGCGFVISALVSFGSLTFLVKIIQKRKLSVFAWYMFAIGIAVVGWQMLKLQGRG